MFAGGLWFFYCVAFLFFFPFSSMTKHKRIFSFPSVACISLLVTQEVSQHTYLHSPLSNTVFSAMCRVVEALPLPLSCKTAVTHAFVLQNHISRLKLFNNLIRLGLFFFQLMLPGNKLFFERILKLERKYLTCIFVEYDLISVSNPLLYKKISPS